MFSLLYEEEALRELEALRPFEARRVAEETEKHLARQPLNPTGKKKLLSGLVPPWRQVRPVWQLRVGDFRVFYDVDEGRKQVIVRAVRRKGTRATKEIL